MQATTHDGVIFEIPDEWLREYSLPRGLQHFVSDPAATIINLVDIASPQRIHGVPWFQEARLRHVLQGIALGHVMPPVHVDRPPAGPLPFRMRDGFHRFYASVALGFDAIPARVVPYFDINNC